MEKLILKFPAKNHYIFRTSGILETYNSFHFEGSPFMRIYRFFLFYFFNENYNQFSSFPAKLGHPLMKG